MVDRIYRKFEMMNEILPEDIEKDLARACSLHQRAVSDFVQCTEFSRLMSDLLARLAEADSVSIPAML